MAESLTTTNAALQRAWTTTCGLFAGSLSGYPSHAPTKVVTGTTRAPSEVPPVVRPEILDSESVSTRAMSFRGVTSGWPSAAQGVLAGRRRSDMGRVTAGRGAPSGHKEMIELCALGNRTNLSFVPQPMNQIHRAVHAHPAISLLVPYTCPDMATRAVLDPTNSIVLPRAARAVLHEHTRHLIARLRLRYARIRFVPRTRRQVLQRPSGARLRFVSRCPRRQYMAFMESKCSARTCYRQDGLNERGCE